MCCITVFFVQK
jgi:hypothetical protein